MTFIDILFGFTLTEAFTGLATTTSKQDSVRAGLALAVVVVSLSWLGYHNHAHEKHHHVSFWSLTFLQFALDVLIVGLYYLLVRAAVDQRVGDTEAPDLASATWVMVMIFVAYALWDVLDLRWEPGRRPQACVTALWLVLMLVVGQLVRDGSYATPREVWLVCGLYAALAYLYRVVQEIVGRRFGSRV